MSLSVPEAAAIGICLTNRILGTARGGWHPAVCRYCGSPKQELLDALADYQANGAKAAESEYRRLSGAERDRRLRDAQEPPRRQWFEEVEVAP